MKVTRVLRSIGVYLFSITASHSFLFSLAYACGDSYWVGPKPYQPGCERLEVVIHNETKYNFEIDTDYTEVSSTGGAPLKIGNFSSIPANSVKTLTFDGVKVDNNDLDKVDTSMRYYATTASGERVGSKFLVNAKKNSCNVYNAKIRFDSDRCYSHNKIWNGDIPATYHPGCELNTNCNGGCSYCTQSSCIAWDFNGNCTDYSCTASMHYKDYICKSSFAYDTYSCEHDGVSVIDNPDVPSSVQVLEGGIFTVGAHFDSNSGANTGKDLTESYTTYRNFTCNKSSECDKSKNGGCQSSNDNNNKPAKLEFYIEPSQIETLTVSLPFDPKTPTAKLLEGSIYNNLNAEYLGRLGNYFSYQPVVMRDQEIAFSTLCNSASCPGAL